MVCGIVHNAGILLQPKSATHIRKHSNFCLGSFHHQPSEFNILLAIAKVATITLKFVAG